MSLIKEKQNIVYLIGYGKYLDSGNIEKLAKNEEAIKNLVETDPYLICGKGVIDVNVDFAKNKVYYKYKDWDDEIEHNVLYLTKFEVVG